MAFWHFPTAPKMSSEISRFRKKPRPAAFRKTTSNEDRQSKKHFVSSQLSGLSGLDRDVFCSRSIWAASSLQGFAKQSRAMSIDAPEPVEKATILQLEGCRYVCKMSAIWYQKSNHKCEIMWNYRKTQIWTGCWDASDWTNRFFQWFFVTTW